MEADVTDGFTLAVDDLHDGFDDFVNQAVPILRRRGLRPDDYQGTTLRDHLGLSEQLGLDPRRPATRETKTTRQSRLITRPDTDPRSTRQRTCEEPRQSIRRPGVPMAHSAREHVLGSLIGQA
jgi:hypothetical protein